MRHALSILMCALVGTVLGAPVRTDVEETTTDTADTPENPYQAIVDRNVFGLRPPPPPAAKAEEAKPPPPKITLTGITTLLGKKLAFMKTPPTPVKPGEQSKGDNYYMMTEGQLDGDLEVLQIDERAATVKIRYSGIVSTLDFTNNGAKAVAAPMAPMAPMPTAMPAPGTGIPAPGIVRPPQAMPGTVPMPSRTLRLPTPTPTGGAVPTSAGGYSYNTANPNLTLNTAAGHVALPLAGSTPTPNTQNQLHQWQNQTPVEQQFIMVEAERERTRNQVAAGLLPPLPPTPLTPPGSAGAVTPGPQQNVVKQVPQLPLPPGMPQPLPQ